ncbi:MAG: hypothetical protein P8O72_04595 [Flavobacteriaceae bacterium]|nr:hypothetical protein [Flavobacteriaceae bacterium]
MKQTLLIFLLISTYSISQTKLYVHPDGDNYAKNTQTIALLPLNVQVKLRPKQLKDFTSEQIEEMEKNESLDIQKGMHSWFLTRKKRGEFSKSIQTPQRTNALLKKAGIDIHTTSDYLPSELGKILGVDCVVTGSFETSKPMSDAASIAIGALFGAFGSTSSAVCNIDFYDTRDDELVVNYLKKIKGSLGSDSQDLINILMRKVTRRIPYTNQ